MISLEPKHEYWMHQALIFALYSLSKGEIPVGAVLICENKIIGNGWNNSINSHDPTAHAEIMAIRHGGITLRNYRLVNTTLYVTLEPCLMCAGAILRSRINTLVYGAKNNKNINLKNLVDMFRQLNLNYKIKLISGVLELTSSNLLKNFFIMRRLKQ